MLQKRAILINEKFWGPNHVGNNPARTNLAILYHKQGQYAKAERIYKLSLINVEREMGPNHPSLINILNNLSMVYRDRGSYSDAEQFLKRSLSIYEENTHLKNTHFATLLVNWSSFYFEQGRFDETEKLLKKALFIYKNILGPDHPAVGSSVRNLGNLYRVQGHYADAQILLKKSLVILENSLGSHHPLVGLSLQNLALLYIDQQNHTDAEKLFKRALFINEQAFGSEHPNSAIILRNLADTSTLLGKPKDSLFYIRQAVAITQYHSISSDIVENSHRAEQKLNRDKFISHVITTLEFYDPPDRKSLIAEAFETAQLAMITGTERAIQSMAVRFETNDEKLSLLIRQRQDLVERLRSSDQALGSSIIKPLEERNRVLEEKRFQSLKEIPGRLKEIDEQLKLFFPEFTELTNSVPAKIADVQALLKTDEALLFFLISDERTFIFAIRPDAILVDELKYSGKQIREAVNKLRKGLDKAGLDELPPFDTSAAFALYQKIFKPLEFLLRDAKHIFVVPDGALTSLPLGLLVTEKPTVPKPHSEAYQEVPWLIKRYAISVLPSVSSLRSLRKVAKPSIAQKPFLGIGDPELGGEVSPIRGLELTNSPESVFVEYARSLNPLPETRDELNALAISLNAGSESLLFGKAANEKVLKSMKLSDYRVIAFATHGLVAGELQGLNEPALVLTPPILKTKTDDGLLKASEVAQLKLNADWVILSACNTAAADGKLGGQRLSGLAKAFFYAGSRALFVSHWPVLSDAAVALTTQMLAEISEKNVGRAEAHRLAMITMIESGNPNMAHPALWAPFVVVGDGGR